MATFYQCISKSGEVLFNNLPIELTEEIKRQSRSQKIIPITLNNQITDCRIGERISSHGSIYTLTDDKRLVNRFKFFKEVLDQSLIILENLNTCRQSLIEEQSSKIDELIHNIVSLNTYSIQSLYALIPQKDLPENINPQKDFIKKIILEKPNVTVDTLLKLIKNNLAMKIEFSVYERINNPRIRLNRINYSVRMIILSIMQIFSDDFDKKNIEISLDASPISERRIDIDDDALFVSLFYLFENSLKYCCNNTKYVIFFSEDTDTFSVSFKMISVKINEDEIDKLLEYGYRSNNVKQLNIEGKGIGMFRIVKTLEANNAILKITPRCSTYTKDVGGTIYEANTFTIIFKDQKQWLLKK